MTPEFNLLDEKWIRVLCQDYSVKEVSLTEALTQAHTYRDLAGELKAQDVAVMRLLLAVLHTVFSRVNEEGEPDPIEEKGDALERWAVLWNERAFPEVPIRKYLERYRDRFYLFHPEYPFYQVPEAAIGTEYSAAKLNGELSESSNKLRLFPVRTGEKRGAVTSPEAARWLLYINGYDDTSSKPKGKGLPSPGAGWLGRLGIVTAVGDNLFETLMLNLALLQDGEKVWAEDRPIWERAPRTAERVEIPLPDNPAELLTLQSRRILLKRDKGQVVGYHLLGGDFFPRENAFAEQMTIWRGIRDKKGPTGNFQPQRHDRSRQVWRDFAILAVQKEGQHIPGIVRWLTTLQEKEILPENRMAQLKITSVQYGDKDFFITDEFGDSLSFSAALLTEKGETWQALVLDEIDRCEKRAYWVGNLARELVRAAGGDEKEETSQSGEAKEKFFYRLDLPFRNWLASLRPEQGGSEREEKQKEWNETVGRIARTLGREMVEESGPAAFGGREVAESGKGKKDTDTDRRTPKADSAEQKSRHYSAPEALNRFLYQMNKIEKGE